MGECSPTDPAQNRDTLRDWIRSDEALSALLSTASERMSDDPGHDLAHAQRVAMWTLRLAGPGVDRREAVAAALLHDLVNIPKDDLRRDQASALSAEGARPLLSHSDFDAAAQERICDAIRDHSYSRGAQPTTPLGEALQDADRLEALGAIGIFRTISTGVRMGASYFDRDDPWASARSLDDRAHTVDHFFVKLLGLPATMNTRAGRREALRRVGIMRELLAQLGHELGIPAPTMGENP